MNPSLSMMTLLKKGAKVTCSCSNRFLGSVVRPLSLNGPDVKEIGQGI